MRRDLGGVGGREGSRGKEKTKVCRHTRDNIYTGAIMGMRVESASIVVCSPYIWIFIST